LRCESEAWGGSVVDVPMLANDRQHHQVLLIEDVSHVVTVSLGLSTSVNV